MPWDGSSFAKKHNHSLHGEGASKAASIANAILRSGGSDAIAIATANKYANKHRADGGLTLNDLESRDDIGYIKRQATDPEKVKQDIIQKYNLGPTGYRDAEDYAAALRSYENARDSEAPGPRARGGEAGVNYALGIVHRDSGGYAPPAALTMGERMEARSLLSERPYGFTAGIGGGRTDKNDVTVGSGGYVLPADVVAGLGDGNSLAGAHVWNQILSSMPYGVTPPKAGGHHLSWPAPPHDAYLMQGITGSRADGGDVVGSIVPIRSADGEILISPEDVMRVGKHYAPARYQSNPRALMRRGHRVLDGFVKRVRGHTIKHLKTLRGPVGSENPSQGHV